MSTPKKRRGRPRVYAEGLSSMIWVRVPVHVATAAKREATRRGVSLSSVYRGWIEDGMVVDFDAQIAAARERSAPVHAEPS